MPKGLIVVYVGEQDRRLVNRQSEEIPVDDVIKREGERKQKATINVDQPVVSRLQELPKSAHVLTAPHMRAFRAI